MNDGVFTSPQDLISAVVEQALGKAFVELSIEEQLALKLRPGHAVGFRTESGSLYDLTIYYSKPSLLVKVNEETDEMDHVAAGELAVARDRNRGVVGIVITEPGGRRYTTSAVVKVWTAFDGTTRVWGSEPH